MFHLGKLASQINTYRSPSGKAFGPEYALDGVYLPPDIETASLSHTAITLNHWWRVDLGQPPCIWAVNVLIRASKLFLQLHCRGKLYATNVMNFKKFSSQKNCISWQMK